MQINLTPIFQAVIGLLAAIITYKISPWIREKTTNEQRARLDAAIKTAVFAAEQIYGAGKGADKMQYAVRYLREHGFDIDTREIEAAVGEFFNIARADSIVVMEPEENDEPA